MSGRELVRFWMRSTVRWRSEGGVSSSSGSYCWCMIGVGGGTRHSEVYAYRLAASLRSSSTFYDGFSFCILSSRLRFFKYKQVR